jgi:hypothetical protein
MDGGTPGLRAAVGNMTIQRMPDVHPFDLEKSETFRLA